MIPRKKLDIPAEVSGRPVTNRGVHLQPFGFHGDWLEQASYWVDLLVHMGVSWVVIINDDDSVRQKYHTPSSPLQVLLDAGIIPIIREQRHLPHRFSDHDTFRWTVDLYGQYGLKPLWVIRNEPFDDREWARRAVPSNAWDIVMGIWAEAAQFIVANGGYVGFPDGPAYDFNPFESIKEYDCQWIFDEGKGFYTGHHYGKNRHRDYPYDAVTRHGAQLTEEAYRRSLDDFADDPQWMEEPIELINQSRVDLASPDLTAMEDDMCWRGWEKNVHRSLESFGYVVPMAMTEGGWVPRDRVGSGPNTDIRLPHTTPKMVAKKTLQMFDTPSPFFAICPWLLADEDMGGSGRSLDAWHGWAYRERYGRRKPVIDLLRYVQPKEIKPRTSPMVIDLEGDTRNWKWVRQTHGVGFRQGKTNLRLIEVHEYEGCATLDVWVVDGDGLPVEGIPFYYYFPDAPAISDPEWYDRGILNTTGPDGRISFPVSGEPNRAGTCEGAIWPQGKGDVLEKLGLLTGTNNRHLNGMWQLTEEDVTPPELTREAEPKSAPEPEPEPERERSSAWEMAVEYRPGARVIAGSFPRAGITLTITDPWGDASQVTSGSKPEYGPGGFEVLAPHPVVYTLAFLGEVFGLEMRDGIAIVTFSEKAEPYPDPEPDPNREPDRWARLFKKLDRITGLVSRLPEK